MCSTHYNQRVLVDGPFLPHTVWDRIDKSGPGGCWLWLGSRNKKGYGFFFLDQRRRAVHRYIYELVVGPIPDGLVIDHLCRVRNCVNPEHLEPVTSLENLARGIGPNALGIRDNTCMRGHEFTEENTRWRRDRPNERVCRRCHREQTTGARRTA